ncbi:hypothetical protein M407DRAFT_205834 [Tulasnella calospora MUT 4182]|uniref:Uncharacterized protein n=1 Tax=Tulasnella calospora MUT 4182 TaxID=1051891 RepID=A0A0C3LX30_9AGAM|nr:hypothetical protein M407DRAFT_205834 [Tulasnella calospora MUT 4182]
MLASQLFDLSLTPPPTSISFPHPLPPSRRLEKNTFHVTLFVSLIFRATLFSPLLRAHHPHPLRFCFHFDHA